MNRQQNVNPYEVPSVDESTRVTVVDDPVTRMRVAVSFIAFGFVGIWFFYLLLFPTTFRISPTIGFKIVTTAGTTLAVLCVHYLAHAWWHILAFGLATVLIMLQLNIWRILIP